MPASNLCLRTAFSFVAFLALSTASRADYTYRTIVESDETLLAFTSGPSLNNAGQVVFVAELDDPTSSNSDYGLYRADGDSIQQLAFSNGLSPYRDVSFATFPSINNSGDVLFYAVSFSQGVGVFTGPDPINDAIASDVNSPFSGFGANPTINDAGTVLFQATIPGGVNGLYFGSDPVVDLYIDNSGPFAQLSTQLDLNNVGQPVFAARLDDGVQGLFTGTDPVADRFVDSTGPFGTLFSTPRINDAGQIVFYAQLDSGVTGLFTGPDPATDTIIDDSGAVELIGGAMINNQADIVYSAIFDNGRIGVFDGPDLDNDQVVVTGMPMFGSTVVSFNGYKAFNDLGQFAFSYVLEDGKSGIAIASPLQPGDYNRDGDIDADDYAVWADTYGQTQDPAGGAADGNGDGVVNAADYTVWRDNLAPTASSAPEPTGVAIAALGAVSALKPRRLRAQSVRR